MTMNRKAKLTVWLVVGVAMALGPIIGTLPGIIGMVMTFRHLDEGGWQAEIFDESIDVSVWLILAGLVVCPIGIVVAVISAVKLIRNKGS
jgi:hypothetical protein